MKQVLRLAGLRVVERAKRRLKTAAWLRSLPLMRYTYLFDVSTGIVVPELKLCFVPTPKAANRSIKAAVASVARPGYRGDPHLAGWQYRPVATLKETGFEGFGFVRNPLDRLYSCYAQKIVLYGRLRSMPIEFWRYGSAFHPDMSFEAFVRAVAGIPDRLADIHFRSQHRFLYFRGEPTVGFIGRFETLDRDWERVRQRFGLPELAHYNRSPHRSYREAYTPALARIAAERYDQDIQLFGYQEEVAALTEPRTGGA